MPATEPTSLPNRRRARIKLPPVLFDRTQKVVQRIEQALGCSFLTYWNSNNGSVCQNDVLGIYGVLRRLGPQKRVGLFIKSDGAPARPRS